MSDYLDGAALGLVGVGLFAVNGHHTHRMAEYQRQQLNILRRHQGLPPIAPPPQPMEFWVYGVILGLRATAALVTTSLFWFWYGPEGETTGVEVWGGIALGVVVFAWLTHRGGVKRRNQYLALLQRWADAGCP